MKPSLSASETIHRKDMAGPPIFVVGSARSGTTLLYHMLLSSDLFARFFGEPAVFDSLVPRFGDLSIAKNRQWLTDSWLELTGPLDVASDTFRLIKATNPLFFSAKHWLKQHTKAGRLTAINRMRAA